MLVKTLKTSLFAVAIAAFLYSCGTEGDKESTNTDETAINEEENSVESEPVEEVAPIICLWSKVSVKKEPKLKGKWLTTMNLGETATYQGISRTDTTVKKGKEYAKIELIDGKTGWVEQRFFAIDAKPSVIKDVSKIYDRPDILSGGKKDFDKMQFVVVTEEKGEWMKVKGKRAKDTWFAEGWVKANHLTDNNLDVSVAILASRAMTIADKDKKIEALNEIIDNSDFSSSIFIKDISSVVFDLSEENAAVEETEDFED